MDTIVKITRLLLVTSAIAGFVGKTVYALTSGLAFASALSEGFIFGLTMPLVVGTFCSFIWMIAGFYREHQSNQSIHRNPNP